MSRKLLVPTLPRRNHSFKLSASPYELRVRALGRPTVEHLDAGMNRIGTIDAGTPAVVADGQYLAVSHYVWRYRAADSDARRASRHGDA